MEEDRPLPPAIPPMRPRTLFMRLTLLSRLLIICLRSNGLFEDALKSYGAASKTLLLEVLLLLWFDAPTKLESTGAPASCCCCVTVIDIMLVPLVPPDRFLLRRKLNNGVSFPFFSPMTEEMLPFFLALLSSLPFDCAFPGLLLLLLFVIC